MALLLCALVYLLFFAQIAQSPPRFTSVTKPSGRRTAFARSYVGIGGIRKEQLLAVDLVVGNGLLAVGRHQPIDELLTENLLHVGVPSWVHQYDAVLIEQVPVALHKNFKIAP